MAAVKKFRAVCKERVAVCITAWDYPTALLAEEAHMDLVLVGDSTAIVSQGHSSTVSMTLDEMIYHCKAVARGAPSPFLLGDLPLGTYEKSPEQAIESSLRLIKEGHVDGVKLEGGAELAPTVAAITRAGVPVVGHIGLTPQRALAGLEEEGEAFGTTAKTAQMVLEDALAIQKAGAIAVVLEAVAAPASQMITQVLRIPTIGIGCGASTSAQIAVQSELLGYKNVFVQKWHKKYANIFEESAQALKDFHKEVVSKQFPTAKQTYEMPQGEMARFHRFIGEQQMARKEGYQPDS